MQHTAQHLVRRPHGPVQALSFFARPFFPGLLYILSICLVHRHFDYGQSSGKWLEYWVCGIMHVDHSRYFSMKDFTQLTPEELEKMDKRVLITIIRSLQGQLTTISSQLTFLTDQIALMNQRSFGRKTERADQLIDSQQMTIYDYFNEPEAFSDDSKEPEITTVVVSTHTRKKKTKREDKLEGLPARIYDHTIDPEKLKELFPNGYKELPCEIYKRLAIIPQTFLVDEHHVHVYASKNNDGTMVKAERPRDLFRNSIATPSLVATILTGKYLNHLPLDRQSRCLKDNGIQLETNTLANWMMNASDDYLRIIYDRLHKDLYSSHLVHADETPFEVIKDGRSAGSKSYMWVYRNGACDTEHPVVIYDYQPTRKADNPSEFLKGYSGVVLTDGYQVYHTLERKRDDLRIAGCWIHAKRGFVEYVKSVGTGNESGIISDKAVKKISELIHLDNQFDDLPPDERLKQRQLVLKPKVDDFFAWVRTSLPKVPAGGATAKALNYCLNQESYLRVFLSDPLIPMDNNRAEQAIRPFTLGRKNWVNMYSTRGAQSSAVLYSLVETAKANSLNVYEYFDYLLTELSAHADDPDPSFVEELLPWTKTTQEKCRSRKKA